jgi:Ni/Co efflux regulator RcnB
MIVRRLGRRKAEQFRTHYPIVTQARSAKSNVKANRHVSDHRRHALPPEERLRAQTPGAIMKKISALVVAVTLLGTSAALAQYNENNSNQDRGANGQQQTEPQGRNNNQDKSQNTNQRGQNGYQSGSQESASTKNRQGSNEVRDNPHFSRGDKLSSEYRDNSHVVSDWKGNHLRQPPSGYHWVQANNQYVLAAVASGVIADIMASNQNQRTR